MLDRNKTIQKIAEYVKKGYTKFAIYPFGENGEKTNDIFSKIFNINNIVLIDNNLYKYNELIVSWNDFLHSNVSDDQIIVILTIEDSVLNSIFFQEVSQYIKKENICNLFDDVSYTYNEKDSIRNAIRPSKLLCSQAKEIALRGGDKKRIRFLDTHINILKPLIDSFSKRKVDILVIVQDLANIPGLKNQNRIDWLKANGIKYICWQEYNPREDNPDVLFVFDPYMTNTYLGDIRKYTRYIICLSIQLIRYTHTKDEYIELFHKGFDRWEPDYFLFDTLMYKELESYPFFDANRFIEMGHPKFDGIYNALKERSYPLGWEKLKGKKIIVYTTDHGYKADSASEHVTFDIYAKSIFEYARNHKDIGIIFRPHFNLVRELVEYNYWTQNDLKEFIDGCEQSPNIVFDNQSTYDIAFSLADALITDSYCGIICSALPTKKPICVLYRDSRSKSFHPELTDNYYNVYDVEGIRDFLELFLKGIDTKKEARISSINKYIKHFDGRNGQRVTEFTMGLLMD